MEHPVTHTIIAIAELQRLAQEQAIAVVTAEETGGSGEALNQQPLDSTGIKEEYMVSNVASCQVFVKKWDALVQDIARGA